MRGDPGSCLIVLLCGAVGAVAALVAAVGAAGQALGAW